MSSLAELQAAIANASGETTITVTEDIDVTSTITIPSGKNITLTGSSGSEWLNVGSSCSGSGISVAAGGELTLSNITVDGTGHSAELISVGGTFTMETGAVVQNNGDTGVYVSGTFVMNGGKITGNRTTGWGGGIYGTDNDNVSITIKSGEISNNYSGYDTTDHTSAVKGGGGGIYLNCGALHIIGGQITGNEAYSNGGGIAIGNYSGTHYYDISITGGKIFGNRATYGQNIITYAPIKLGATSVVTDGICLFKQSTAANWEENGPWIELTEDIGYEITIEGVFCNSGTSSVGYRVAKMSQRAMNEENASHISLADDVPYGLVVGADGDLRLANKASGFPLRFTTRDTVITGGVADSQSGDGWSWDKDTLTLTISEDVEFTADAPFSSNSALTLPGNATLIVDEEVTASFMGTSRDYGISAGDGLKIQGGGTLRAGCNGSYTSAIISHGLKAENVTMNLSGSEEYEYGIYSNGMTLDNCTVNCNNLWLSLYSNLGDVKISDSTVTIDNTTAGLYFRNGNTEITGNTFTITNASYGINTDIGDTVIRNSNISISGSDFALFYNARTPGEKKVEIVGGEFSVQDFSYGVVAQYADVVATGSKLSINSSVGVYTEGDGSETVTLTDCTGYLGMDDQENGHMAVMSYGADSSVNPQEKIFINNLDPSLYELGTFTESDGQGGESYGATVYTLGESPASNYVLLGIQPTGITLDKDTMTLYLNREEQKSQSLEATVTPDNVTDKTVSWSSSDTNVASVDENGTVTVTNLYDVDITAEHGSVAGAGSYEEGAFVALTASPDEGYHFVGWKASGSEDIISTDASYSFTIAGDTALTAIFEEHTIADGWKSNGDHHWKECSVCGERLDEAAHTFKWVTDREATATEAGLRHEECAVCGYAKEAVPISAGETTAEGNQTGGTATPKTGDSSHIALWFSLILASCAAVTGSAVYSRRRKDNR